MVRRPPSFVVTTPESLYLLVTSERGRAALRTVETVIVDEIHAVARDKRGAHLALTLERLEALCDRRPMRIGLSATQRPVETVGRLLVGDRALPAVVDVGHQRHVDLGLELPDGEMEAVASAEQMSDTLDRIAALVGEHRTTLVFVNTRRLAERLAHQLGERLGDDVVAAHHGSLSKERRLRVETRLRAGDLRALVATASLELGIDIGPVELVCQIGSPRSIATFLQRVGRSNHSRAGTPKGRLFPLTRDELVECAALLAAVRAGRLDAIQLPLMPLDIAAQQVVAEVSATGVARPTSCTGCCAGPRTTRSSRRPSSTRSCNSSATASRPGRGRRGAYLYHDEVNGELRPRKGRASGGGHVRRRHPRDRRLPGRGRPRRHVRGHGQRGLGRGVDGRRHLPARQPLLADPPGRARRGTGPRRRRHAADRAVLAGRGTGPDDRAVRGGVRGSASRSTSTWRPATPTGPGGGWSRCAGSTATRPA